MDANNKFNRMQRILIRANFNRSAAVRMYRETYPDDIPTPSRQSFRRLAERLEQEGNAARRQHHAEHPRNNDLIQFVRLIIQENPHLSVRAIARQTGLSKSSIHRALKNSLQLYPYRAKEHQQLILRDFENRRIFCTWALQKIREEPDFFQRVLFTDEATFLNTKGINKQNCRYWAVGNPRWLRQIPSQHQWKLNVWCGIIGNHVIGPYFFDTTLNGERYANFLIDTLPILLEKVPLDVRVRMWYQQDGAPAHRVRYCVNILNQKFSRSWIGLNGPIAWPARSPDLTPLDFFLWGKIKDLVYATAPTTQEDMRQRIIDACASINVEELRNVQASLIRKFQWCLDENGGHFEHLQN